MAVQPLSGGLRAACKTAWLGHVFPASEPDRRSDANGTARPYLPEDLVRVIDAIARAAERAERLQYEPPGRESKEYCAEHGQECVPSFSLPCPARCLVLAPSNLMAGGSRVSMHDPVLKSHQIWCM